MISSYDAHKVAVGTCHASPQTPLPGSWRPTIRVSTPQNPFFFFPPISKQEINKEKKKPKQTKRNQETPFFSVHYYYYYYYKYSSGNNTLKIMLFDDPRQGRPGHLWIVTDCSGDDVVAELMDCMNFYFLTVLLVYNLHCTFLACLQPHLHSLGSASFGHSVKTIHVYHTYVHRYMAKK